MAGEIHEDGVAPAKAGHRAVQSYLWIRARLDYVVLLPHGSGGGEDRRAVLAPVVPDALRFGVVAIALQPDDDDPLQWRPAIGRRPLPAGPLLLCRHQASGPLKPRQPLAHHTRGLFGRRQTGPQREEARQREVGVASLVDPVVVEAETALVIPHQLVHRRGPLLRTPAPRRRTP